MFAWLRFGGSRSVVAICGEDDGEGFRAYLF